MSKFVDAELAERIIKLDPEDLRAILFDLLTPAETQAAVERLISLKDELKVLQSKKQLLKPDQWTSAVLQQVRAENSSYYARESSDQLGG